MIAARGEPALTADNAVLILVSFEGPDAYSQTGDLGVRVSELAATVASLGFETHLFFAGDPGLAAEEAREDGRLVLHRWGQWISRFNPGGVYEAEAARVEDLTASLPAYVVERIIQPAVRAGRVPIVLSEEWQTAACTQAIADHCDAIGIRDRVVLFWNASNPYGFDQIDWARLAVTNTITVVSRRMRGILRARGVDALVIPNGIPERLLRPVGPNARRLRAAFAGSRLLFRMARPERQEGWTQALDTIALLRDRHRSATLVARSGGPNGAGDGLVAEARERGLFAVELSSADDAPSRITMIARRKPHVVSLRFGVDESLARIFYAAADAVLANSVSEPFSRVGLEAMAAGGVVVTGGTGSDYSVSPRNAVVLETPQPDEIVRRSEELAASPASATRIRRAARAAARRYTWREVARTIVTGAEYQIRRQGGPTRTLAAHERRQDSASRNLSVT